MKLVFLKSTELEDMMKSVYNFTKRAFFDVMNEESRYVSRKGVKEHSIQLIKMLSKEPAVDKSQ